LLVAYLEALPEVVGTFNVAGRWDFLLHVAVPSVEHLKEFTQHSLAARPEVRRIETSLVFEHRSKSVRPAWGHRGD
jgi:DNA-binding Lrp family transcriptional regulator